MINREIISLRKQITLLRIELEKVQNELTDLKRQTFAKSLNKTDEEKVE